MFAIDGQVQHYPWGSTEEIPQLLGLPATGEPYAEYWLGAHPKAPARTAEGDLQRYIAAEPTVLGTESRARFGDRLPYLFKLLSATRALSIQAHPSRTQAEAGYAREEAAGLAPDDPLRNYRDDWPKPELIVALSRFEGLCGFADPLETRDRLARLGVPDLTALSAPLEAGAPGIAEVFGTLLRRRDPALVEAGVAAANRYADPAGDDFARWCATAVGLAADYPGDPGVLAALLMHRFALDPGQALFLPAGNLHAYLHGTGIEVMSNSDNVLRGGLTGKHMDVDELTAVVDFAPGFPGPVVTAEVAPGVLRYETPAPEFSLYRLERTQTDLPQPGSARIGYVLDGELTLHTPNPGDADLRLGPGRSCFVPAGESVRAECTGRVFVAAPGTR